MNNTANEMKGEFFSARLYGVVDEYGTALAWYCVGRFTSRAGHRFLVPVAGRDGRTVYAWVTGERRGQARDRVRMGDFYAKKAEALNDARALYTVHLLTEAEIADIRRVL